MFCSIRSIHLLRGGGGVAAVYNFAFESATKEVHINLLIFQNMQATKGALSQFQHDGDDVNNEVSEVLWLDASQVIPIPDEGPPPPNHDRLPQAYAEGESPSSNLVGNHHSMSVLGVGEGGQVSFFPAYPTPDTSGEYDRQIARTATRRGRQAAAGEIDDIRRHNRIIPYINANEIETVRVANQRAAYTNILEETGQIQTSRNGGGYDATNYSHVAGGAVPTASKQQQQQPPSRRAAPELYQGTYGKPYETSEYDTREYDTMPYDTAEYKSVYDP